MNKVLILIVTLLLSSCISTGDIEGIVDKGGKAYALGQGANSVKTLADTRKIKAKTAQKKALMLGEITSTLDEDKKYNLVNKQLETQVALAKNNRYKGMIEASIFWLFLMALARVVRYFFDKYVPSETIKKYN